MKRARNDYENAKPWLKKLLNAYAINYYLYKTQQSNLFYYNTSNLGIRCCGQTESIGAISMGSKYRRIKSILFWYTDKILRYNQQ
jgi:hypothetical protein